jgi:hypothetical protein
MLCRRAKFESFATHPWLSRVYRRLKPEDRALALEFIAANAALNRGDFELRVNRMFLDRPKPKNFALILELLTCANSGC